MTPPSSQTHPIPPPAAPPRTFVPSRSEVLQSLRQFLRGDGDGESLVTMQEWVTGMTSHAVIGKYPLHIFRFLPHSPGSSAMTPEERLETALTIADEFFEEKMTPSELKKIAQTVSSDTGLKHYLFAMVLNWTRDKIRISAQSDDTLHLGMRIEKTLRRFPDVFMEVFPGDNWRESIWTRVGAAVTRKSPPDVMDDLRRKAAPIAAIPRKRTRSTRYRDRLVSTPNLVKLLTDVLGLLGEPLSILELLAVASEKIPLSILPHTDISADAVSGLADEPMIDRLPDLSQPDESALIDRFDLPSCAAEFLDSLDELDSEILRNVLEAAFSGTPGSARQIGGEIIEKFSLPASTYYFRRERLKRRLSGVLSEQDELLFYQELRAQLESRSKVTFRTKKEVEPDAIIP
ncbi:hypothetical protein HY522_01600 [bacterium]|nr:hypothetical protein [bacterium]